MVQKTFGILIRVLFIMYSSFLVLSLVVGHTAVFFVKNQELVKLYSQFLSDQVLKDTASIATLLAALVILDTINAIAKKICLISQGASHG